MVNPGNAYHVVFSIGLGFPLTPNPAMCRSWVCHADDLYWMFSSWNGGDGWAVSTVDHTSGRGDAGGDQAVVRDGADGESELRGERR